MRHPGACGHTPQARGAAWKGRAHGVCGLLGLLTARADAPDRVTDVTAATRCARHRGPDETDVWHNQDVVFGFNRLAIIDLASSSRSSR